MVADDVANEVTMSRAEHH